MGSVNQIEPSDFTTTSFGEFSRLPSKESISTVIDSAKQFPLALTFESTRAFVLVNQGLDDRVRPGMEVLAINGESLAEILKLGFEARRV